METWGGVGVGRDAERLIGQQAHLGGGVQPLQVGGRVLLDEAGGAGVGQDDLHHPLDELSPDRILQAKQEASVAMAALAELSPRTRAAFMLVRFEGLSYKAVAAQLGISVSAVEKHVTKALRIISIRLQETDERQPATRRFFR